MGAVVHQHCQGHQRQPVPGHRQHLSQPEDPELADTEDLGERRAPDCRLTRHRYILQVKVNRRLLYVWQDLRGICLALVSAILVSSQLTETLAEPGAGLRTVGQLRGRKASHTMI